MKTNRNDYFSWDRTTKFVKTPEGFYQGRAVVTNVGVFPYRQKDGSIRWELRPPEEVFKDSHMVSLRGKPVTNEHPSEFVTSKNASEYAVGSVGDSVSRDDYHLVAFLTILDEEAVADLEKGKRGLSCGYGAIIKTEAVTYENSYDNDGERVAKTYPCPGVWNGVYYDAIQTEMEINHVAIVDRGRAGDAARIRMDGAMIMHEELVAQNPQTQEDSKMKKLTLDNGLSYDVAPEVAVEVESLRSKIKNLDTAVETAKSEAKTATDTLRAEISSKDEKIATLQAHVDGEVERVKEAVKARAGLLATAGKFGVELKGDESDAKVRELVVKKLKPAAKIDGESEDFVKAYFKIAVDEVSVEGKTDDSNRSSLTDIPGSEGGEGGEQRVDHATRREQARKKMIDETTKK